MREQKGVFLDLETVDCGDLNLAALKQVLPQWQWHAATRTNETAERIRDATIVVSNKVVLDRESLRQARQLRLICVAATGTNNVDLQAAHELDISVTNVAGYATPSVVQHVFSLMLTLITRLADYSQAVANGAWQRSRQFCLLDFPIQELAGKRLGIVGYGELGRAVAEVAKAFGMQVLVAQRPGGSSQPNRIPLEALLPQVDLLSLHCPLAENTKNLIGQRELGLMKKGALLINTARGGIVDEAALAAALRSGKIGGAGVDVLVQEPPTKGNPLLEPGIPNLIVTPHIAWASREARQRLVDELTANIQAFLRAEERNRIGMPGRFK
ncbi:MAG: 2-hydroxyacid dehydrogenase [Candidatus Polarisedimenticolaceae bacterium]|nr:2-hydroxyacid dehydrogenase [Candidatus Polarisedimenticolaceae bacterium]